MNALKSYSSDDEADTNRPTKSVKDGDPGTNYDSVGMDISEDSDEGNPSVASSKMDGAKIMQPRNNNPSSQGDYGEKSISREKRDAVREGSSSGSSRDSREHSSRDARSHRNDDRDRHRHHRDGGRSGRYDRKRGSDSFHRRGRDRSRSRDRRRGRSRSRERHRRSRSKSDERRRPNDIRRDAQHKLAAMKAANPNFDQTDLLRQSMVEQIAEVEKQTGLTLPTYYNPATMNPVKLAEQERKKRLLWGNKNKPSAEEPTVATPSTSYNALPPCDMQGALWANTKFNNDNDGKMAEKFKRLMGVKPGGPGTPGEERKLETDAFKKQESMFVSMEKQYETARMVTHTQKGFGLGFSSQPYLPK